MYTVHHLLASQNCPKLRKIQRDQTLSVYNVYMFDVW